MMKLFQWKDEYELGLPRIDAQHRKMVDMLNQLYEAKKTDQVHQVIDATLQGLVAYAKVHFTDEETAMREAGYPLLDEQRREHEEMADKVNTMRNHLLQGGEPSIFELLNFMAEWLKNHISGSDRKFGDFIREQNRMTMAPDDSDRRQA